MKRFICNIDSFTLHYNYDNDDGDDDGVSDVMNKAEMCGKSIGSVALCVSYEPTFN